MMKELGLKAPEHRVKIALVASCFNRFVTDQLLAGALDALRKNGVQDDDITIAWVPGAYELPLAAERVLSEDLADAVIALGSVIRGGTAHFEYVAGECARGLTEVGLKHAKPVIFGVLTTDSVEQALERAATDEGNKGFDCAMAALHMLGLEEQLTGRGLADQ
jgi:6,7-dimethyl-8-ribityllumazine synthase